MANDSKSPNMKDRFFDWLFRFPTPSPEELKRREDALGAVIEEPQQFQDAMMQEIEDSLTRAFRAGLDEANKGLTSSAATARWARLGPVKQWAFDQRAAQPDGSRAALIRDIAQQVRIMAREAGVPLTGDDQAVIATITGWFRKAKIS